MMNRLLIFLGLMVLSLPCGCRQESDPPPSFVGAEGVEGVPIDVFARPVDKAILVSAEPAPDVEEIAEKKPEPAKTGTDAVDQGEPIEIDDSTPDGVAVAYVEIMFSGKLNQLADIVIPEQEEPARMVAQAGGPFIRARERFANAWQKQFSEATSPFEDGVRIDTPVKFQAAYTFMDMEEKEDTAVATLTVDETGEDLKIELQKTDGGWRIEDPTLPAADALEKMADRFDELREVAKDLEHLAQRISDGDFEDADAAREALEALLP